ncbi:MAG TPA: calcium-binding protein [Burkholderiales bacterium]|nr:calcium-binding protein [Burkholderiales bacterium]
MPLDILAIQRIYGANMSFHTGDDVYALSTDLAYRTIWDADGTDTIDASGLPSGFTPIIDLNSGAYSGRNALNALTAIAYGTVIENAIGSTNNDTIIGNAANNNLSGGAGDDTISGGDGDDTINGGSGSNILNGGPGNDIISGVGLDTILGGDGNDTISIARGIAHGNAGNDTISIESGSGEAEVFGDDGDDNITLKSGTAHGGNGADTITVILGNSVLSGDAGNDTLTGAAGPDVLDGGTGADTMIGGFGNDTYVVDDTGDAITENSGEGTDIVQSSISYVLGPNLDNLTLIGTAAIDGTGNADNNVITGNGNNNTLNGGGGVDELRGGPGNDSYILNDGLLSEPLDAVLESVNEGIDFVFTPFNYTLPANVENLTLTGSDNVNGTGNELDNVLTGNGGNNVLDGGAGTDTAIYSGDRSGYTITLHSDGSFTVTGSGAGTDTLSGIEFLQFVNDRLNSTRTFPAPRPPSVTPTGPQMVATNHSVAASSLFSATDPDGDTITQYEIQDVGTDATSGHFTLNGVAQPQGDATFTISAAQLGQLQYSGGSVVGSEPVWVRASDAGTFGDWKRFVINTEPNQGPVVTPPAGTLPVLMNRSVAASLLFSAADPEGDTVVQYELQDVGTGATSGHFTLNGIAQPQGDATFTVSAAQLSQLQYAGAGVAGSEAVWVRASDGTTFGDWTRFVMRSENVYSGPVVVPKADTQTVLTGSSVAASSLFAALDPDGDAITQYEFQDVGTTDGRFLLNSAVQPQGDATFTVSAAQLSQLQYTSLFLGSEPVWVRASDGTAFGDWTRFVMSTESSLFGPLIKPTADTQTVVSGRSVPASSLFSAVGRDAITQYEFQDVGAGATSGRFTLNGVAQPQGDASFAVSTAQLGLLQYTGGSATGSEAVWARASDSTGFGDWKRFAMSTIAA